MLSPFIAVRSILIENAGVRAIVDDRVVTLSVTQGIVYPCIVLAGVTGMTEEDLVTQGGQNTYRITVECRSGDIGECDRLGKAVCAALDNFTGIAGGLDIDRIRRASETFIYDDPSALYRRPIDFRVYYA